MTKLNVLIFPCGTEIGLELHRSLCWAKNIKLYGASSVELNHGEYVFENYVEELVPFVDEPDFIEVFNSIIEKYKIDVVFPAHDSAVLKLAQVRGKLNCDVVGSPEETCSITRSKSATYRVLKDIITTPIVYEEIKEIVEYPVFLKPDVGEGAKGTSIANSYEELMFHISRNPSLLALEYLPGTEYTIDCFTDRHGSLRFVGPRERARISNGISVSSRIIEDSKNFREIAKKINEVLIFRGVWFFQLKVNREGKLSLLEISPRVAGSMGLYRGKGVNLPLLSIFDYLNVEIDVIDNDYQIKMDRALVSKYKTNLRYQNVYVDLDDTIIVDGKINTKIITFIYQCINEKKKIILITRHRGDLELTLKEYKLQDLFDEVIHLKGDEKKSAFIIGKNSIFIDDSYAERREVRNSMQIPTFDLDGIDVLLSDKK